METITNAATTAASTVSNLIYGQPTKDNETAGSEPVSGQQGKGTASEPFDQGNAVNPTSGSSNTTSDTTGKSDEYLKLNPTIGTTSNTESATHASPATTSGVSMPIIPLNPDVATSGTEQKNVSSTDTTWKSTPLDEVKNSGAPGAGPDAPTNVTPAVPESTQGSSTTNKESVGDKVDSTKDSKTDSEGTGDKKPTGHAQTSHVAPEVDAILEGEHPKKTEHSVPEELASDPHSMMEGGTKRNTDASKPDPTGEAKVVDTSSDKHETKHESKSPDTSKPAAESSSPTGAEEKEGKVSLKDKLKTKLHIGSKDK